MLEPGECLVGEPHHEQPHPTEDLRVPVGVDLVQSRGGERPGKGNSQQEHRAQAAPSVSTTAMPARKNGR